MRFTVTGEWRRNSLLRLIIVAFLVYGAALWVTNALRCGRFPRKQTAQTLEVR